MAGIEIKFELAEIEIKFELAGIEIELRLMAGIEMKQHGLT